MAAPLKHELGVRGMVACKLGMKGVAALLNHELGVRGMVAHVLGVRGGWLHQ